MARGSVQRRFPQRLRGSALALDYNHGVAETSPFGEIPGTHAVFALSLSALWSGPSDGYGGYSTHRHYGAPEYWETRERM